MLQQTVERLRPLIPPKQTWSVTNAEQALTLCKQLSAAAHGKVLTEPFGRNTAAAIALAAVHIRHVAKGDALMAVLPADHYIAKAERYREIVLAALDVARVPGRMVVLGIPPTRLDTGFGYIERRGPSFGAGKFEVFQFAALPRSRTSQLPKSMSRPECTSGTRGCFSGECLRS